jgi:hypothetical protein
MPRFRHTLCALTLAMLPVTAAAQQQDSLPAWLRDRGTGIPTSMFGTYVRPGELLLYPFFEYYRDNNAEYSPEELGFGLDQDFRGRYRAYEGLIFLGYGFNDWLAVELETAVIKATLHTAPEDPTAVPDRIEESGWGDIEGQLRARWMKENSGRPELFSFLEVVVPHHKDRPLIPLIGTPDWEFKLGSGVIRGFRWGTVTLRAAIEYSAEESKIELGEFAVEYLKRLSPAWRIYLGMEGNQDEVELIPELQWHFGRSVILKINSAIGLTSKATDWAPEIGVMFSFY